MFTRLGFKDEPMPDFESRFPGRLEGSLQQPFSRFGGIIFYRGVLKKAVALFYFCTKDHPFENGNKRFAVTIMLYFLVKNGYWLNIHPEALYEIAKVVADIKDRPEIAIASLYRKFKPYLEPLNSNEFK